MLCKIKLKPGWASCQLGHALSSHDEIVDCRRPSQNRPLLCRLWSEIVFLFVASFRSPNQERRQFTCPSSSSMEGSPKHLGERDSLVANLKHQKKSERSYEVFQSFVASARLLCVFGYFRCFLLIFFIHLSCFSCFSWLVFFFVGLDILNIQEGSESKLLSYPAKGCFWVSFSRDSFSML